MNGSTVKKINKFVDILIVNTPKDELNKDRDTLIKEVRELWQTKGKAGKKFIDTVVNGGFMGGDI